MTLSARFFALAVALAFSPFAFAAEIPKPPDANKARVEVGRMQTGAVRVKDPENKQDWEKNLKAIETVAEWFAYRIATPPYNGEAVPREDKTPPYIDRSMSALMQEMEGYTRLNASATGTGRLTVEQVEYGAEFGKAVAKAAKVVLTNASRPIERINAVRMMSIAARMPCPDLAEYFIDIINGKYSDAEKLYAFEGVKNLMEQSDIIDPSKHVIRDVNQLGKLAMAVSGFITQDRAPKDDRETSVIQFVRRHAVAALAAFRDGVYRKPTRELIFRPSWTLMRVIASDPSVSPPFTIQEKIEAIIGFCQMRNDPDMNLDVAAYMIAVAPLPSASGTTLGGLVEFAREANEDVLRALRDKTLPTVPWKLAAARMSLALANWREIAKSTPKDRNPDVVIALVTRQGIPLLASIEKEGGGAATGGDVQNITNWAGSNAPKAWSENPPQAAQLYKDDPKSVLPFAAPAKKTPTDSKLTTPAPTPMTPPDKGPNPKTVDPKKEPPKK